MAVSRFSLKQVGALAQKNLKEHFPSAESRLRSVLELYSSAPNELYLPDGVTTAFDLPVISTPPIEPPEKHGKGKKIKQRKKGRETKPQEEEELDVFDRWLNEEPLADQTLHNWRQLVFGAISSAIDWDLEGLAHIKSKFQSRLINFEGQRTRPGTGDITLKISRSPEAALALRGLTTQFQGFSEDIIQDCLFYASQCISSWADTIRNQLLQLVALPGMQGPMNMAVEVLSFGAFLRGIANPSMSNSQLLQKALTLWTDDIPVGRSKPWMSLWRSFKRNSESVKKQLFNSLVCTKGGSIRDTSMIDPTPILSSLQNVRENGAPQKLPKGFEKWQNNAALISLLKDIEKSFEHALLEETKACQNWIKAMTEILGISKEFDFNSIRNRVVRALELASNLAVLKGQGSLHLIELIKTIESNTFRKCFNQVQEALSKDKLAEKVSAIALIDRETMNDFFSLLKNTDTVLDDTITNTQDRIIAQGEGRESVEDLIEEISKMLGELKKNLKILTGG
jgi:hypothetical protein